MDEQSLFKLSAITAMAGGVLRIAGAFASILTAQQAELLYFLTDLFLLLGLSGIYLSQRHVLGWAGYLGALIAFCGLLMIRSADLFGGYATGAAISIAGFSLMGVAMLRARSDVAAAVLWIAALGLGIAGAVFNMGILAMLAGIAFGAGFAWAGWMLYRRA